MRNNTAIIVIRTTLSFMILVFFFMFGLLVLKGLPSFAADEQVTVLGWVCQVTWLPALLSGLFLSLVMIGIHPRLAFFVQPYDFGRCFSVGGIAGALAEALSTWAYRTLSQRPFSGFWIGGAMISGFFAGALIVSYLLWRAKFRN